MAHKIESVHTGKRGINMYETGQALIWIAVAALYFTLTAILKRRIYVSALPGAAAALLLALLGAQMA